VSIQTILILAENDEVVGVEQGKKLSNSISSEHTSVYIVKGAGHNSIYGMQAFFSIFSKALTQ
jgi:hypothetical protein